MPSTAWGAGTATHPQPSFLPGVSSPSWLEGVPEARELVMLVEPITTMLYLAGYEVPEIAFGVANAAGQWATFTPDDLRLRPGTTTWSTHLGVAHPGTGKRAVAIRAEPMAHLQNRLDGVGPPISLPLTVAGATIDAARPAWIVLDLSPQTVFTSVFAASQELLAPLITAVTNFQASRTIDQPIGLAGLFDPSNWRTVPAGMPAPSKPADLRETLQRVTLLLTEGPSVLFNDADPNTAPLPIDDRVPGFLQTEIAGLGRPVFKVDQIYGWESVQRKVADKHLGIRDDIKAKGQLAALASAGCDPDLQSLTTTILDLHDRGHVDVLGEFTVAPAAADPCPAAIAFAEDVDTPLTPEAVTTMCECLARGITSHSDLVAGRLATEYPVLYRDTDARAQIRDAMIGACVAGGSLNTSFNSSGAAAPELESAEHFADMLAVVLASDPDLEAPGFDESAYSDPLVEASDAWDRWNAHLNEPAARPKLMSLTALVFADCGHPDVIRRAAEAVVGHYRPSLANLWQAGHHWSDPFHGSEFQDAGSTSAGREGWREEILVALLAMLATTHEGDDVAHLHDDLIELAGFDPLRHFDLVEFEEEYADRLNRSTDPIVAEYALMLRVMSGYVEAATETAAACFNAAALQARFAAVIAEPTLPAELEAIRAEAFEDVDADDEGRTFVQLRADIEAFVATPRHQLLLICLGANGRQEYQDGLVDRVRRVCPLANETVIDVIVGVGMTIEADVLMSTLTEAQLVAVLEDLETAYEFPKTSFTRYLGKAIKESGSGLPKAYLALALRNAQQALDDPVRDTTRLIASVRVTLFVSGMNQTNRSQYLLVMAALRNNGREYETLKAGLGTSFGVPTLGYACSVFVAGAVVKKFFEDGAPTEVESAVSQLRDLVMGSAAIPQFAGVVITTFFKNNAVLVSVAEAIAVGGTWLSGMSSFVSFFANGLMAVRYFDDEDYVGAILVGAASALNLIALVCAFFPLLPLTATIGAVAAALSAILLLIDVVRHLPQLRPFQHALWNDVVGGHELMFTPSVEIVAPVSGDFVLTAGLPFAGEVALGGIGAITPFPDAPEGDLQFGYFDVDIDAGITGIYATTPDSGGPVNVSSPIPAMVSAADNTALAERIVMAGELLLTVRPRFESWVEASGGGFDEVLVERNDPVSEGAVVARFGGAPVLAPHAGTVGTLELAENGIDVARIRIWAEVAA